MLCALLLASVLGIEGGTRLILLFIASVVRRFALIGGVALVRRFACVRRLAEASRCAGVTCSSIERCDEATGAVGSCPPARLHPATGPAGFIMAKGFTTNGGANGAARAHTDSDRPHKVVLTRPFCMDEPRSRSRR